MRILAHGFLAIFCLVLIRCTPANTKQASTDQPVYQDTPYLQDLSVKYYTQIGNTILKKCLRDRNNNIQILADNELLKTHDGRFLYPGTLIPDHYYRPMKDKKITDMLSYKDQFVYLDDKAVFSNAWAGKLYIHHELPDAHMFAAGASFDFLVSDGTALEYLANNKSSWKGLMEKDQALDIKYDSQLKQFWILGSRTVSRFNPSSQQLKKVFSGSDLTSFAIFGEKIVLGTTNGYIEINNSGEQIGQVHRHLPWTEITAVEAIDGHLWFGSTKGAFMLRDDGKFNYYYGERWLPGDEVVCLSAGIDHNVLILTKAGLGQITFKKMTLHDKAMYFEKQVRSRHIRNGFNSALSNMQKGNIDSGRLHDSDNDGLWTSMYLAGEAFRYATTKSEEALQNCRESLEAMERLYTINPVPGFPSRSFERSGYMEKLSDPHRWQHAADPEWDWKATTSSDEAIGHIFVFGVIAETMADTDLKDRAIMLIDTLMSHILKNDLYLVDYNGKPTQWGRWNPEYVNARPIMVGDRKICSSNIIAMLQTAYHFTHKEKYKDKAFELLTRYGYMDNLMRPMKEIGHAPEDADLLSKNLSDAWNHSDDEMYFIGYWGLYRYALNDTLKARYKEAILDHWEIERPEKEGAWDIFTALTGTPNFDLENAIWYLKEHPMDLIDWVIQNSHRRDITFIEPNFRNQTLAEVLPPDERPVQRHNGNMFNLDRNSGNGTSEHSAGDIWLLPYWMGRYLGVISAPENE